MERKKWTCLFNSNLSFCSQTSVFGIITSDDANQSKPDLEYDSDADIPINPELYLESESNLEYDSDGDIPIDTELNQESDSEQEEGAVGGNQDEDDN